MMKGERGIDEVFRYESKKRSTIDGIVQAALAGDRKAICDFAGLAAVAVESPNDDLRGVAFWLIDVLDRIHHGEEPNVAFGWKRKIGGRPPPSQDMEGLRKQWLIGQHMVGLVGVPMSQRAAAKIVAESRNVSVEDAIRCHNAFACK